VCGAQHIQTFLTLYKTCVLLTTNHNNQQVHIKWLKIIHVIYDFQSFYVYLLVAVITYKYFIRIQPTQSFDSSNPNKVPLAKKWIHSTTPNIISSSKNMDAHHSLQTWQPAWKTGLNWWHKIKGKLLPVSEVCTLYFPCRERQPFSCQWTKSFHNSRKAEDSRQATSVWPSSCAVTIHMFRLLHSTKDAYTCSI